MRAVDRRVVALLRSYVDALDAWESGSSGGGVKLMPSMWNEGSYSELERALRVLRDGSAHERTLWWHVSARYLWTRSRIASVPVRRARLGPVAVAPPHSEIAVVYEMSGALARVRLTTWSEVVLDKLVSDGVARLSEVMYAGDAGRVVVPRSIVLDLA